MLGIGYVVVICIICSCSECIGKLDYLCNIRQDKYNQVR